jgi:hypothetical protein
VAPDHARHDVAEVAVPVAVELFEGVCVSFHLYLQISEAPVSFSDARGASTRPRNQARDDLLQH